MKKYARIQSGLVVAEIAGDSSIRKAAAKTLGVPQQRIFKEGHRETFPDVIRREGFLYVINRAISSRTNENYDTWPAEEIAHPGPHLGYSTFVGKPIFVEHANDNHRRTRGVNIAASLHPDHNPDGSPDTWVGLLKEVDPVKFPKLSRAILTGRVNTTSMGADVGESYCSKCGNKATSPAEYCGHIPTAKGALFEQMDHKTGSKSHGLVSEICRKIAFFEDTFIVTTPADPTAHVLVVEGREAVPAEPQRPRSLLVPFTSAAAATEGGDPEDDTQELPEGLDGRLGAKELTLPPRIDTLNNTTCPVCGSENSFHGNRCSVCNSVKPPDALMDPDTSVAPKIQDWIEDNLDPAEDVEDLEPGPDLQCPECGSQFTSQFKDEAQGNPYTVPAANQKEPADEDLGEEAEELGLAPGEEGQDEDAEDDGQPDQEDDEDEDEDIGPEKPPAKDVDDLTNEQDQSDFPPDEDAPEAGAEDEDPNAEEEQAEEEDPEDPEEILGEDEDEDEAGLAEGGYSEGDVCPACGEGLLEPLEADEASADNTVPVEGDPGEDGDEEDEDGNPFAGGSSDEDPESNEEDVDEDEPSSDDDEDEEDENDEPPPFAKKKKSAALTPWEGTLSTMPTRRTPGRVTPKGTQPKTANQVGVQRTALLEAMQVHAQRQEEDHAAIARVAAVVQEQSRVLSQAKTIINNQANVIRRQAVHMEALALRNQTLERQMAHLAASSPRPHQEALVAIGREGYRRMAALQKRANPANPAQPIMEPNPEAPVVTEQQAMQPGARDDVTQLGATPATDVSADATISVDQPYGEYANQPVGMNRVDVTAPVEGTQFQRPPSETIIPVDVRVGNPDNPQEAFPWTMGPVGANGPGIPPGPSVGNPPQGAQPQAQGNKRAFATLHLAKLQIQAGIASGDDLEIAASLDASAMSDSEIQGQIQTLSKVVEANHRTASQQPPTVSAEPTRRLVPKAAAADPGMKSMPSFQIPTPSYSGANPEAPRGVSVGSVSSDELAFE